MASAGFLDVFVARYYSNGTLAWAKRAGGSDREYCYGLTRLPDDSIAACGYNFGSSTFGPGEPNQTVLASSDAGDVFIAHFEE